MITSFLRFHNQNMIFYGRLSAVHFYKLQVFEFVFAFQIMKNTAKNAACLRGAVITATVASGASATVQIYHSWLKMTVQRCVRSTPQFVVKPLSTNYFLSFIVLQSNIAIIN